MKDSYNKTTWKDLAVSSQQSKRKKVFKGKVIILVNILDGSKRIVLMDLEFIMKEKASRKQGITSRKECGKEMHLEKIQKLIRCRNLLKVNVIKKLRDQIKS